MNFLIEWCILVFEYVEVPHFHQLFLPLIDISKLVNHHARFGSQPIRIAFTFTINVQLFGLNGQAGRCVVVQSEKQMSHRASATKAKYQHNQGIEG